MDTNITSNIVCHKCTCTCLIVVYRLLLVRNGAFQPKEPKENFPSEKEPLLQSTDIVKEGQSPSYYSVSVNGKTTIQ